MTTTESQETTLAGQEPAPTEQLDVWYIRYTTKGKFFSNLAYVRKGKLEQFLIDKGVDEINEISLRGVQ